MSDRRAASEIDRRFHRGHKIDRMALCLLFGDESIHVALVHTCRGHTLKEPFVCQFLGQITKSQFATRAQRDCARFRHVFRAPSEPAEL
jgi:hypothetical protein